MAGDRRTTERILNVLRPYASNWTGTLGKGDLVIPQREAGDTDLFQVLMAARRAESVQDQADLLRRAFRILLR